jgi:hypothetical protein
MTNDGFKELGGVTEITDQRILNEAMARAMSMGLILNAEGAIQKHLPGQHDQGNHGRGTPGVPDGVDTKGRRFSKEEALLLSEKIKAAKAARDDAHDKLTEEIFGKPFSELPEFGDESIPTPPGLTDSYSDRPGQLSVSRSSARGEDFWALVDSQPEVIAAKEELEGNYLWKEMMSQEAAGGGTLGENQRFVNEMMHRGMFFGRGGSDEDDPVNLKTMNEFRSFYVGDNEINYSGPPLTMDEVKESANAQWQEYLDDSTPSIIVSQSVARQIVSQESVRTVWETGSRPSRAGTSDDSYMNNRKAYENMAFGYTDSTPIDTRPVSGIMTNGNPNYEYLDIYGGKNAAAINLKPEVKERMTITANDSLNTWGIPSPVTNPNPVAGNSQAVRATMYNRTTGRNYYKDYPSNVAEIQTHGGVRLSDIGSVTLFGRPSDTVLASLDRKNVPYEIRERPTSEADFGQTN